MYKYIFTYKLSRFKLVQWEAEYFWLKGDAYNEGTDPLNFLKHFHCKIPHTLTASQRVNEKTCGRVNQRRQGQS